MMKQLLIDILSFQKRHNLTDSMLSKCIGKDPRLIKRIKTGAYINARTFEKIYNLLETYEASPFQIKDKRIGNKYAKKK